MNRKPDLAEEADSAYTFATQYVQATKADGARTVVAENGGRQDKRGLQPKEKNAVFSFSDQICRCENSLKCSLIYILVYIYTNTN